MYTAYQTQQPTIGAYTESKTILITEDDAGIGSFLVEAIWQETSYKAFLTRDAFQALKVIQDIKPDLFILDYGLPGMNGIELHDRLHTMKELQDVPTMMMSAHLPVQEIHKRNIIGLKKPFDLSELLDTIEKVLA